MTGSVRKAISRLMNDINENPFLFSKERDIHSILYGHLRNEFPKFYEFKVVDSKYKTSLIHSEYFGWGPNERIDIVVFHPSDIKNIQIKYGALSKEGKKKNGKSDPLDLKAAIEIKFNFGADGEAIEKKVEYDIIKLERIREKQGKKVELHFIYIVRWPQDKEEVMKKEKMRVKIFKKWCVDKGIIFHTNSSKNYFPRYK